MDKKLAKALIEVSIRSKTIVENSWKGFAIKVIPEIRADSIQYIEMRKAYYGGFYTNFDLMIQLSDLYDEDTAAEMLSAIQEECETELKKIADWKSLTKERR
jgi:hypothetical protein